MNTRLHPLPSEGIERCGFTGRRLIFYGLVEMDTEASKYFFYDPIERDGKKYGEITVWCHYEAKPFQDLIEEQRERIFLGDMSTIPYRAKKRVTDFFGEFCTHHFDRVSKTSVSSLDLEFGGGELSLELLKRLTPIGECELFWTTKAAQKEVQELVDAFNHLVDEIHTKAEESTKIIHDVRKKNGD